MIYTAMRILKTTMATLLVDRISILELVISRGDLGQQVLMIKHVKHKWRFSTSSTLGQRQANLLLA